MFFQFFNHPSTIASILHLIIVVVLTFRIIMKRPEPGVGLAWLFLIASVPFGGALIYILIGERRISRTRIRRIDQFRSDYQKIAHASLRDRLPAVDWSQHNLLAQGIGLLGESIVGLHATSGSHLQIFSDTEAILKAIAADIDSAQKSVLMEFYIWNEGGAADEVLAALIRAVERGVSCRVLIDAIGARPWWKSKQPKQLRAAGVLVQPALPAGLIHMLFGRFDLRLHRKIVVIDGKSAWTGSMNLVDPRFFKQDSGVGQWVDAMVRVTGPAVVPLAATMVGDWALETGDSLNVLMTDAGLHITEPKGTADIQVVPTGPGTTSDGLLQMMLALVNAAQSEIILTTPYLVPDISLVRALRGASGRGVKVSIILPEKVDSLLTRYASKSYYDDLLETGAEIFLYRDGLLHTKSIMVDGAMSMFGTANLDMRSLWLNYEVALFIFNKEFAEKLRELQNSYLKNSDSIDPRVWSDRPRSQRVLENVFRLVSPLL